MVDVVTIYILYIYCYGRCYCHISHCDSHSELIRLMLLPIDFIIMWLMELPHIVYRLMLLPCCVYVADVITTVADGIATCQPG